MYLVQDHTLSSKTPELWSLNSLEEKIPIKKFKTQAIYVYLFTKLDNYCTNREHTLKIM